MSASVPGRLLRPIDVVGIRAHSDPVTAVRDALDNPVGLPRPLPEVVSPADRVVVVVSDSFRQTRADVVLPHLIRRLNDRGVSSTNIELLFSTGTHRGPTPPEQRIVLGDSVYLDFRDRIHIHDAHDRSAHVFVGTTSRGTRVEVNRRIVECDRLFVTGAVVLHYFAGFGGGRKSIVPGLASAATIAQNHVLNVHSTENRLDPAVRIGVVRGNPVAEDMLEASLMVKVDGIVNTVLTKTNEIAEVFAGDMRLAHEAACKCATTIFTTKIPRRAPLVVAASAHTKNFVQTHKALFNAWQALEPGGRIILAAPCPEGLGGQQFEKWLDHGSPENIFAALRLQSDINGQTALSTRQKAPSTLFVTELSEADVAKLGGRKCASLQDAVDQAAAELGPDPFDFYTMPNAAYSVPVMR